MHVIRAPAVVLGLSFLAAAAVPAAAPVTDAGSGDLSARLAKVEKALDNRGLVDMLAQLQSLQQEIARLRGEIEVQNHTFEQLRAAQREQYAHLDERLRRMETGIGTAPAGPATEAATAPAEQNPPLEDLPPAVTDEEAPGGDSGQPALTVETIDKPPAPAAPAAQPAEAATTVAAAAPAIIATPPVDDPVRERDDYQQAFKLLKQSLYEQAIKAFREFLAAHPGSEYADNAQYWLGEAYYVTRQYDHALSEYQALASKYPASQKVPDALLKIGYSYQELGKEDEAKRQFSDLRQRFPGTTAARLADDRLKTMGSAQSGRATH